MSEQKNILIIKLGALGDFILQLGWVFALYHKYPNARFTFMTTKPFVPFVKSMPFVSDIIVDSRPRYNLKEWWKICKKRIADTKWDYIFDLQISKRTRHKYFNFSRFLTKYNMHWACLDEKGFIVKNVEKKGRFSLGKLTYEQIDFEPFPVDLTFLKGDGKNFSLLPEKKFLLVIPGCSANHPYKRWPKEKYLELVLKAQENEIASVVLGTNAEKEEIEYICQNSNAISFQNKASLLDIPAIAKTASVVIGNDTGPVHMSCFSKTPAIVLFCEKTARSANNLPNVTNLVAKDIANISVEKVWDEVEKYIGKI